MTKNVFFPLFFSKLGIINCLKFTLASWSSIEQITGEAPQLKGAIYFSYDELRKLTNNFSISNEIGAGGYGKVNVQVFIPLILQF